MFQNPSYHYPSLGYVHFLIDSHSSLTSYNLNNDIRLATVHKSHVDAGKMEEEIKRKELVKYS